MATLKLKGTFVQVFPVELVGENKDFRIQKVLFMVPGWVDGFGDKGEDEPWEFTVKGNNIDKLKLTEAFEGKKAECKIFVNSKMVQGEGKKTIFIISAALWEFDLKEGRS